MDPRYSLSVGEEGHVYLLDGETGYDLCLGHLDSAATWRRCPAGLRGELDELEEEWREVQAERERIGREDRRCWEAEYLASRGV